MAAMFPFNLIIYRSLRMTFSLGTCLKQIYAAFVGKCKGKMKSTVIEQLPVSGRELLGSLWFQDGHHVREWLIINFDCGDFADFSQSEMVSGAKSTLFNDYILIIIKVRIAFCQKRVKSPKIRLIIVRRCWKRSFSKSFCLVYVHINYWKSPKIN